MRQSAKETTMLHMQAECTFDPRESGLLIADSVGAGELSPVSAAKDPDRSPWLRPGR